MSTIQIDRLLDTVVRTGASDLHCTVGRKPTLRLHGGLKNLDTKVLDGDEIGTLLRDVTLYDLARVFKEAMENRPVMSQFELNREPIKLEQQKEFLFKYFDGDGRLKFSTLLKNLKTRLEIIVTFLAILDLVREGTCTFEQNDVFDEIELIHLGAAA